MLKYEDGRISHINNGFLVYLSPTSINRDIFVADDEFYAATLEDAVKLLADSLALESE